MSELISRQAAIDAIENLQLTIMRSIFEHEQWIFRGLSDALMAIKELPSEQPQPQWIPCSVRMPENDESVLISLKDGRVFEGQWSDDADFPIWSACYGESSAYPREVVAWMPFPEPYKGDK